MNVSYLSSTSVVRKQRFRSPSWDYTTCSSYKSLKPKTRALLGLGLMANAGFALYFSNEIESFLGLHSASKEQENLNNVLPKFTMVDTDKSSQQVQLEAKNR